MIVLGSIALVVIVAFAIISIMYKQALENNVLQHRVSVHGQEETVRLFFISDSHTRQIDDVMIEGIEPVHAVIIGGDFVDKRTKTACLYKNLAMLSKLGPLYFVWGNNDRELPESELRKAFSAYDVTVIKNSAYVLPQTSNLLWLSAIDYVAEPRPQNITQAFEACDEARTVFIAHNPQVFSKVRANYKPLLMMGGHLHGGQIRFGSFGLHAPGSFETRGGIPTLISNGYGTSLLPLRLGAKPQCHVVTLHFSQNTPKNA